MPTTKIELTLRRLHPGQQEIKDQAQRYNVAVCGRRWGKNVLGMDRAIEPALQGKPVGWFSPSYKMLEQDWRQFLVTLYPVIARKDEQSRRIDLITKGYLEFWSLEDPDASRGRAYRRIVVDEAATVRHLQYAWVNVLRPELTDYQGDAWFLSTPKGLNYFHQLYLYGQDPAMPEWVSWRRPSRDNPFLPPGEIELMRAGMTEEAYRQEVLAEFLTTGGVVFRRIDEAAIALRQDRAIPNHVYVIGVDWGQVEDFSVFAVVDVTMKACVYLDRMREVDYLMQAQRLTTLYEQFRPKRVVIERNMESSLLEVLSRQGLPVHGFQTTAESKRVAIEALQLAFERKEITLIRDEVLLGELKAYTAERMPSGLFRYGAPEGMHDDTVMALAMAWQAVSEVPKVTVNYKSLPQPAWR